MVVFDVFRLLHRRSVILPNRDLIYYSASSLPGADSEIFCVLLRDMDKNYFFNTMSRRGYSSVDVWKGYYALRYRRQSSVLLFDRDFFRLRRFFTLSPRPYSGSHDALNRMVGFYSKCRRRYAAVLSRSDFGSEKVLCVFDRYVNAFDLIRYRINKKVRHLLETGFEVDNSYPYLWVERMDSPILLLQEYSTRFDTYDLGRDWSRCFLCFLSGSSVDDLCVSSAFGFVLKDEFGRVLYCD